MKCYANKHQCTSIIEEIKNNAFLIMTQIKCLKCYLEVVEQTPYKNHLLNHLCFLSSEEKEKLCNILPNTQAKPK